MKGQAWLLTVSTWEEHIPFAWKCKSDVYGLCLTLNTKEQYISNIMNNPSKNDHFRDTISKTIWSTIYCNTKLGSKIFKPIKMCYKTQLIKRQDTDWNIYISYFFLHFLSRQVYSWQIPGCVVIVLSEKVYFSFSFKG